MPKKPPEPAQGSQLPVKASAAQEKKGIFSGVKTALERRHKEAEERARRVRQLEANFYSRETADLQRSGLLTPSILTRASALAGLAEADSRALHWIDHMHEAAVDSERRHSEAMGIVRLNREERQPLREVRQSLASERAFKTDINQISRREQDRFILNDTQAFILRTVLFHVSEQDTAEDLVLTPYTRYCNSQAAYNSRYGSGVRDRSGSRQVALDTAYETSLGLSEYFRLEDYERVSVADITGAMAQLFTAGLQAELSEQQQRVFQRRDVLTIIRQLLADPEAARLAFDRPFSQTEFDTWVFRLNRRLVMQDGVYFFEKRTAREQSLRNTDRIAGAKMTEAIRKSLPQLAANAEARRRNLPELMRQRELQRRVGRDKLLLELANINTAINQARAIDTLSQRVWQWLRGRAKIYTGQIAELRANEQRRLQIHTKLASEFPDLLDVSAPERIDEAALDYQLHQDARRPVAATSTPVSEAAQLGRQAQRAREQQ